MALIRVVRMVFRPEETERFDALFERFQPRIAAVVGCDSVICRRDPDDPRVRYTLSHWRDVGSLDAYRHSSLFREMWGQAKALFVEPALAWSLVPDNASDRAIEEGDSHA